MTIADDCSQMSHARRKKVGAVLIQGDNIISHGWNGTPSGDDNNCEHELENGELVTKPEVTHAEMNVFGKLLDSPQPVSTKNSTLYVTLSPCMECAKLIKRAGVSTVIYRDQYKSEDGIKHLTERGVNVIRYGDIIRDE